MKHLIVLIMITLASTSFAADSNFFYKTYENESTELNEAEKTFSSFLQTGLPVDLESLPAGHINGKEVVLKIFGKDLYKTGEPRTSIAFGLVKSSGDKFWTLQVSETQNIEIEKDLILSAIVLL